MFQVIPAGALWTLPRDNNLYAPFDTHKVGPKYDFNFAGMHGVSVPVAPVLQLRRVRGGGAGARPRASRRQRSGRAALAGADASLGLHAAQGRRADGVCPTC